LQGAVNVKNDEGGLLPEGRWSLRKGAVRTCWSMRDLAPRNGALNV